MIYDHPLLNMLLPKTYLNACNPILTGVMFLLMVCNVHGQTTSLGGQINSYTEVTAINYGSNFVTVANPGLFAPYDRVMLIQMNGATIDETQSASFGTVTNLNDAGNYEFATVCEVNGNDIIFINTISRTYDPVSAAVQVVTVPVYVGDVELTATIIPQAWDGTTGGIIAFEVTDTLHMQTRHVNVRRWGFRGGTAQLAGAGCTNGGSGLYHSSTTSTNDNAWKGEGIADYITNKECGIGPQANGGGGGDNHNGGGGGGSNFGAGGIGGRRIPRSIFTCGSTVGTTGVTMTYSNAANRIFMGGGGGAGHANNLLQDGMNGQIGGGIIYVKAAVVDGNSRSFFAFGGGLTNNADEGAGGGGAGGVIILDVDEFFSPTNAIADGRWGNSTNNVGTSNCNGPGGGGGGGVVWLSLASTPANLTTNVAGGAAGTILTTSQTNCTVGSTNGATNGGTGTVLYDYVKPESSTPFAGCTLLGMDLVSFDGEQKDDMVELRWSTASETNNAYFEIERSTDLNDIKPIIRVKGAGNSQQLLSYQSLDLTPVNGGAYYRLKQVDHDHKATYSGWVFIDFSGRNELLNVFPNPTTSGTLNIEFFLKSTDQVEFALTDLAGNVLLEESATYGEAKQVAQLDASGLKPGVYILTLQMGRGIVKSRRVFISQ